MCVCVCVCVCAHARICICVRKRETSADQQGQKPLDIKVGRASDRWMDGLEASLGHVRLILPKAGRGHSGNF